MFDQNNGRENNYQVYLCIIYLVIIYIISILVANKIYKYFWSLASWGTLKSESVWDHTVNKKFNVYSTFTYIKKNSGHVFLRF